CANGRGEIAVPTARARRRMLPLAIIGSVVVVGAVVTIVAMSNRTTTPGEVAVARDATTAVTHDAAVVVAEPDAAIVAAVADAATTTDIDLKARCTSAKTKRES